MPAERSRQDRPRHEKPALTGRGSNTEQELRIRRYTLWVPGGNPMALKDFLKKQFIDVIHWTEPEDGILAYRFPMQDMEIQNGGKLTVRESQMAAFVNEGQIADVFGPGLYTLNTRTLP